MSETEKKSRTGLFSKKKPEVIEKSHSKEHDDPVEDEIQAPLVVEEPVPASFTSLFRSANRFTLSLLFVHAFADLLHVLSYP